MSDPDRPDITLLPGDAAPRPAKPKLKKLRLLVFLVPLSILAVVSTVFGMMMAVASDIPALENDPRYRGAPPENNILVDSHDRPIGRLAGNTNRIYVRYPQISAYMRAAVISVEDERFATNNGVDLKGIARAFVQDVVKGGSRQGGSTITQQFVKQALEAQNRRTLFQKLREAATAYHLNRKWGKKKILQEYLNTIYFGNGAYGVEAAAETYFGQDVNHQGCGTRKRPCAAELQPAEAALLAAVIASPSAYDPVAHPIAAKRRRDIVLEKMYQQKYISFSQYDEARAQALPAPADVRPPVLDVRAPYFVSWIRQQLVDKLGARRAFEGGLKIRTTIDLKLQEAAEGAVKTYLANPAGPTASLVAIDNGTGEVRAMVSGTKPYEDAPFNIATQGQRQPGSSFKPFILAEALKRGYGPGSVWPSRKREFCVRRASKDGPCREIFPVNNFENTYTGQRTLSNALTFSDNAVYAAVGIKVGTKRVAKLAKRMGIRTPVSSNLAMTLGGLREGVTPMDMAHAYETFETGGLRITGSLGAPDGGPVGLKEVTRIVKGKKDDVVLKNKVRRERILPANVAQTATQVMSTVVSQGTGKRAALGEFAAGKTGTTENYGDAWFVGFTDRLTVAVWVGYPDKLVSMAHNFQGGPVEGGTFPALIWHEFLVRANQILDSYGEKERARNGATGPSGPTGASGGSADAAPTGATAPTAPADVPDEGAAGGQTTKPKTGAGQGTGGGTGGGQNQTQQAPDPTPTPAPDPTPTPTPATPATPPATDPGTGGAEPTGGAQPTG